MEARPLPSSDRRERLSHPPHIVPVPSFGLGMAAPAAFCAHAGRHDKPRMAPLVVCTDADSPTGGIVR